MEPTGDENWEDAWPVEVKLETEEDEVNEVDDAFLFSKKRTRGCNTRISHCPHCDYGTIRKDHFKRHVLRHPEQKLFPCEGSEREQKRPRTCSECGYTTMRKDHFKRHMMRHTGEKPYSCLTCGYATTHSIHLKRHIMRQGHKPNPQPEKIDNDFMKKSVRLMTIVKKEPKESFEENNEPEWPLEVKLEEEGNTGAGIHFVRRKREKGPRHCIECGYTTLRSDHFKRHMMRHTGEKPFVCTICNFATSRAVRLKNHMATHSDNNRPYSCELCPYRATQLGRLRTHIRQHMV